MTQQKQMEELYYKEHDALFHYALHAVGNRQSAEDLVQDTFHEAIRKDLLGSGHPNPGAWLMNTLKNKVGTYLRSRKRHQERFVPLDEEVERTYGLETVEKPLLTAEEMIECARKELTLEEFYVFKRIILDGVTHRDVAGELLISEWASQKRLERVRRKLKKFFDAMLAES